MEAVNAQRIKQISQISRGGTGRCGVYRIRAPMPASRPAYDPVARLGEDGLLVEPHMGAARSRVLEDNRLPVPARIPPEEPATRHGGKTRVDISRKLSPDGKRTVLGLD